nr:YlxR family protein [Moorella thermoacetica]
MCVGCRARNDKRNLLRVVRTPEQEVVIDPTGKRAGRGAYLCPRVECLRKAVKSRALERALGVAVSPEVLERLEASFNQEGNHE